MFDIYLNLGITHILDIKAYDHLLFIIALIAPFTIKDWKKVIIMATAFTLGHSVTLIFSTLDLVRFPSNTIEFLIPCTILATALYNILRAGKDIGKKRLLLSYNMAAVFGLIHGMGFSNFLRASLLPGEESSLFTQLLAFNIGIEVAQIIIIGALLIVCFGLEKVFRMKHHYWLYTLSAIAAIISIKLMYNTWPL